MPAKALTALQIIRQAHKRLLKAEYQVNDPQFQAGLHALNQSLLGYHLIATPISANTCGNAVLTPRKRAAKAAQQGRHRVKSV